MPLSIDLPLTPPRTPSELLNAANGQTETTKPQGTVDLRENSTRNIPTSEAALDAVYLITVRHNELRCSQSITLNTPSLNLQLDKLSLTLDFVQVLSGRVSITQIDGAAMAQKRYPVINIKDIPTTTELQLNCVERNIPYRCLDAQMPRCLWLNQVTQ